MAKFAGLLVALGFFGLYLTAPASAQVSFTRAWGWGVANGAGQFETCTTSCQQGIGGGGVGQLNYPAGGVALDSSGDRFVNDEGNNRVVEFSSSGTFVRAWGWGVRDGSSKFETCTTSCQAGLSGSGAGEFYTNEGLAGHGSDVYVADELNNRIDEFSTSGSFIKAWGWGVADGKSQFEACTASCQMGQGEGGAGAVSLPQGVAVDDSGDVFVADDGNNRVDEFSSSGTFIKAWGWGVSGGGSQLETCTTTCYTGYGGAGPGELGSPHDVAVDGSGDVFVDDYGNNRVDEFSSSGTFIKAWGWGVADGMSQFETCTSSCQAGIGGGGAGQLDAAEGIGVDGSGDVFVADSGNARIDVFSSSGTFLKAWGWGVTDGANQFEICTTSCEQGIFGGGAGELSGPWGEVAVNGSGDLFVVDADENRIDEFALASSSTGPPVNIAPPVITGTPTRGKRLSCSKGSWTNHPTSFTYQWYRDATLLAGATGSDYLLGTLDEGTTVTCVVTAKNAAGSASARSNNVKVAVPVVDRCPAAKGKMTGTTIGQIRLGMTRTEARYLYRHHSDRGKHYEDFFCLTPIGVRVGYASPRLLGTLSAAERHKVKGRVVWASTSNPYYSLDGIRPGESITTASAVLDTEPPFHIGLNHWYLARKSGYTAVLKVRNNIVEELGIATNALTMTRHAQSVLMHSFY